MIVLNPICRGSQKGEAEGPPSPILWPRFPPPARTPEGRWGPPNLAELLDAAHGTPVKLNAAADAVDAGADDHDVGFAEGQVVLGAVVGEVQVVGLGRPLGRHRIDLLHHRQDPQVVPHLPYGQLGAAGGRVSAGPNTGTSSGAGAAPPHLSTAKATCLSEKPSCLARCSTAGGMVLCSSRYASSSTAWSVMFFILCRNQRSILVSS